jgi:hypothetical protein
MEVEKCSLLVASNIIELLSLLHSQNIRVPSFHSCTALLLVAENIHLLSELH